MGDVCELFPKESIQMEVQKSECSQLCLRRPLPLFSRKSGVMSSRLPTPSAASEADNYVTPPGPSFLALVPGSLLLRLQ